MKILFDGKINMAIQGFMVGTVKNSDPETEILIAAVESEINQFKVLDVETDFPMVELQVNFFKCSICKQRLEQCNHIVGQAFEGIKCQAIPDSLEFSGVTMNEATVPQVQVTDMIVIQPNKNNQKVTWYGYVSENERIHRIKLVNEQKIISTQALEHFSEFYLANPRGVAELNEQI